MPAVLLLNENFEQVEEGNILAICGEEIVEQVPISDFSRKPASIFRKLQRATEGDLGHL